MNNNLFRSTIDEWHEKPADVVATWRPSAYGILEKEGNILMVAAALTKTKWELPGGGVDNGELVTDAAVREFAEETGYRVKPMNDVPFHISQNNYFNNYHDTFHYGLLITYIVELVNDEPDSSLLHQSVVGEVEAVEWVPLEELTEETVHHAHWPAIQKYLQKK